MEPATPGRVETTGTLPDIINLPTSTSIPDNTGPLDPALNSLTVVYTRNEELWTWNQGKQKRIKTAGPVYSPEISPDGQIIAFLRPVDNFHVELWVINLDATNERRLVSVADLEAAGGTTRDPNAAAIIPHRFQWISGTHTLAFNTEYSYQGPGTVLLDDFNLVDADTMKLSYQLLAGWGGEFFLSPSGEHIALTTSSSLILANLDGTEWRSVFSFEPVITYSDYKYYPTPYWSADGSYLMMAFPPTDPLAEPSEATIMYRIDYEKSTIQEVGRVDTVPFFDSPVSFSPSLDRIAYIASLPTSDEKQRVLDISASNGTGEIQYFKEDLLNFLGWNLGGTQFTFTAGEDQGLFFGSTDQLPQRMNQIQYGIFELRWIDARWFLYLQVQGDQVRLCISSQAGETIVIDTVTGTLLQYDLYRMR